MEYRTQMVIKDEKMVSLLQLLGLSEKEAAVYLAVLELGKAAVSHIGRRTGVNRTTVYAVLDTLAAKGLVSISGKEPKEEYAAESPERLKDFLNQENEKVQREAEAVKRKNHIAEKLLPLLKARHKVGNRPHVRFYDGVDGVRYVYEDTLTSTDGIRAFATFEDMAASLGPYYETYIKKRARKKIFSRGIVPWTPIAAERKKNDAEEYRELVLLPKSMAAIWPEIDIYGDKVAIMSEKEKLGIIIESREIAGAMKKIFELAWERAKQLE